MDSVHRQGRDVIARGAVLIAMLASSPAAFALNPALDVSQYAHTAWRIRDGFTEGTIRAIAQTPDGYLWLGTEFGVLRFDGVRNVPWQPPPDQHLPSNMINCLLAARDGTLWIGTLKGLASWKAGKLTSYAELAGFVVGRLVEDREGSVWVAALAFPNGKLCAIHQCHVRCEGEDGRFGIGVFGLYEDSRGSLWAAVTNGLWRWKPGRPEFHPMPGAADSIQSFAETEDGTLLMATATGIQWFTQEKTEAYPLPGTAGQFVVNSLLRDRDGGLWIGTSSQGLVHVHQGRADVFTLADGLSGELVHAFFEDREGSIWVATLDGLDRFRDVAVPTLSRKQGLSSEIGRASCRERVG